MSEAQVIINQESIRKLWEEIQEIKALLSNERKSRHHDLCDLRKPSSLRPKCDCGLEERK